MIKQLIKDVTYPILKSRPDFLIIGAQKAGTTSLYNYLIQHPRIFDRKSFKEVRYFDRIEHYSKGWSWYLGHFPSKIEKGNQLTGDGSPNYLYYEEVPKLIKKDLRQIKMIAILREPVSRAYSGWRMFHSFEDVPNDHLRRFYDKRTFSAAIKEELEPSFKHEKYPFRYDYIGRGRYVEQLKNYYKYFSKNSILILELSQLQTDPTSTLNTVCNFLEIEHFPLKVLQEITKEKYNIGNYKYSKSNADEEALEFLKSYYMPFNERLYELLGYRYNW